MDQQQFRGGPPGATATMANGASGRNSAAESPSRRRQEDWIEIASQPSSSSLSSIGGDEIITTGLRVHGSSYPPRRRHAGRQPPNHQHSMPQSFVISHAAARGGTSSQEDYDDTESEEDGAPVVRRPVGGPMAPPTHVHTGSRHETTARHESSGYDDDDDDSGDENATALGLPSGAPHVFRPQPNAFSHPPSHLTHRHSTPGAYMGGTSTGPHAGATGPTSRRSSYSRAGSSRNAPQFVSPAYREDNDAALRASLTTLLSCAAAARGLPNRRREGPDALGVGPTSNTAGMQPMDIRLVPEAELMAGTSAPPPSQSSASARAKTKGSSPAATVPPATTAANKKTHAGGFTRSPSTTSSAARGEKSKRAAAGSGQKTSGRATKKKRVETPASTTPETLISPTLLTWVVSAGVVVLVSVVGFGAGYVIGREVGRQEGAAGFISSTGGAPSGPPANATGSCGRDIIGQSSGGGTLRRFRWSSMGRSIVA